MTRATSSFIRPLKVRQCRFDGPGSQRFYRSDIVHHNQVYDRQGMGSRAAQRIAHQPPSKVRCTRWPQKRHDLARRRRSDCIHPSRRAVTPHQSNPLVPRLPMLPYVRPAVLTFTRTAAFEPILHPGSLASVTPLLVAVSTLGSALTPITMLLSR